MAAIDLIETTHPRVRAAFLRKTLARHGIAPDSVSAQAAREAGLL